MLKKVGIVLAVLIVVAGGAFWYLSNQNRTLSPSGKAEFKDKGLNIEVEYSRPSVRDRVIFGTEEQDAVQLYGEYWRFGANESTEITTTTPILFNGKLIPEGRLKSTPSRARMNFW